MIRGKAAQSRIDSAGVLVEPAPRTWRAALLRRIGEPLEIVELLRPNLEWGQVLVRVKYSGVCRSQLMEVRGFRGKDEWLPHLLGHEGVGFVVEVGPGVSKVQAGNRVIIGWVEGDGLDSAAPRFTSTRGESVNAGRSTTFGEYSVVSENRVYLAPDGLDDQVAALLGCALLTGAGMVLNEARLESGQTLLINGAGSVGISALVAALDYPVTTVVAEPRKAMRDQALIMGADDAFDPTDPEEVESFRSTYPNGVHWAIDASGRVEGIEFAFSCLTFDGGKLLFASHPPHGSLLRLDPHDLIRGRQIAGSWGGASLPDSDVRRIAEVITRLNIDLGFMTARRYALDDIPRALSDLEHGRAVRPLISLGERT